MFLKTVTAVFFLLITSLQPLHARQLVDATGKTHNIPDSIEHIICSGAGCLRLLTYLQAQDMIVGVDSIETRHQQLDARPYALANRQFKKMQVFGEFRGHDNPEQIFNLNPFPQVIFKTYSQMGHNPEELEKKTGIPVIVLNYGNLSNQREHMIQALRIMGKALDKNERAEKVISFFENHIEDLHSRTKNIPDNELPAVFLGGVAFKGPHGFQSTEPAYPPFSFIKTNNLARIGIATKKELSHSNIAKEKIIAWNPDYLFLDLSTLRLGENGGGLHELQTDPAYQTLTAVQENKVFGLLPYNLYSSNHGSTLANSYFIGKLLYPEQFNDIDPKQKADEIYTFLVGKPLFGEMNTLFNNHVFNRIQVQ